MGWDDDGDAGDVVDEKKCAISITLKEHSRPALYRLQLPCLVLLFEIIASAITETSLRRH